VLANAAWFDRVDFARLRTRWRHFLSREALGAFLALEVRLSTVLAWLVPPLLAASATMIFIIPQLEELAQANGTYASPAPVRAARWLIANWWLVLPLLMPMSQAIYGRMYVTIFPLQAADIAAPDPSVDAAS
jgi:hypothetical protein